MHRSIVSMVGPPWKLRGQSLSTLQELKDLANYSALSFQVCLLVGGGLTC